MLWFLAFNHTQKSCSWKLANRLHLHRPVWSVMVSVRVQSLLDFDIWIDFSLFDITATKYIDCNEKRQKDISWGTVKPF